MLFVVMISKSATPSELRKTVAHRKDVTNLNLNNEEKLDTATRLALQALQALQDKRETASRCGNA